MDELLCEQVGPGMRASEVTVTFRDSAGGTDFLRTERDFLNEDNGKSYLPVAVVHKDRARALIELPQESERGANRIWVKLSNLRKSSVVPA
jgi:hypothetical protein